MSIKNFRISRQEFILIVLIILIGVGLLSFFFLKGTGKRVRVSRNGETIEEISLDTDTTREYDFDGQVNTLVIRDHQADVTHANCQNQICVNTPAISETGEVIACLPHALIFEIVE